MPTKLTDAELARIQRSVEAPTQSDKEARRLAIRAKSQARAAQWPNTLDAMRQRKDRWKKDKEEREEAVRREIDEQERQLQQKVRAQQIERATKLLYEQTDPMKTLRSKQLLADVVHHRGIQLQQKAKMEELERQDTAEYDRQVLARMAAEEEAANREKQKLQEKSVQLAALQKEQLEQFKQKYIAELREEKREGERMLARAEQDLKEDEENERIRRQRQMQANEETKLANLRLQAHREKQIEMERLEDVKREEDAKKKQLRDAKRDEMRLQKKEAALARKQRMIDLATNNLLQLEKQGEERLQNQSREVRAKEDKELQSREDRRAADRAAIRSSRQQQLDRKAAREEENRRMEREMVAKWVDFGQRSELQSKQDEAETRLTNLQFAIAQKQQADARRRTEMQERAAALLEEKQSKEALAKEMERFQIIAAEAVEEAEQRGLTNVLPIKKAAHSKRIDLLPASGFRV